MAAPTGKADAEHELDDRRRDMFANAGFEGHRAEITALAVSGDRVASTDAARQIAIWRMPPA